MADWYSKYPPVSERPEFRWNVTVTDKYILIEWESDVEITPENLSSFLKSSPTVYVKDTEGRVICFKGKGEPYVYGALFYYYGMILGKGIVPIAFYSDKYGGCVVVKPKCTRLGWFKLGDVLK